MSIFSYLIDIIASLYVIVLLLRLLLQWVGADFYNPLSQGIVQLSAPVTNPLAKVVPSAGAFYGPALVAAILVSWLSLILLASLSGGLTLRVLPILLIPALLKMLFLLVDIYFWGIFIVVISSWVGTQSYPMVRIVAQVMEPYLGLFRRIIPPLGMLDLSPLVAILVLGVIKQKLLPMLYDYVVRLLT